MKIFNLFFPILAFISNLLPLDEMSEWHNSMLFSEKIWKSMNDARIDVVRDGLKVEVAPERKWGLAYFSALYLPNNISSIKVEVANVSKKGRWVMKLRGNLLGDGVDRTLHLFTSTVKGSHTLNLDPRFPLHWKPPIELQLGVEGEPGSYAIFKSLGFIPGRIGRKSKPPANQKSFEAIDLMPDFPRPFKMIDWRSLARSYIDFVFDFNKKGEFLPLIWIDDTDKNQSAFGLKSYVGTDQKGSDHEAVTTLSALLTASLMGMDKSQFIPMARAYFSEETGLVLNNKGMKNTSGDWWYDIWPSMLFLMLWDRNPRLDDRKILKSIADRWYEACLHLKGDEGLPDFNHTAFDFKSLKPIDRGWEEPDSAAGIAWLEYIAWVRLGNARYLQAVDWCLRSLEKQKRNPYYEVLLPWGAYIAARANAEPGKSYDLEKLLNWCFGMSDYRGGWGTLLGKWGGEDCYGLVGSATDLGGYAYAMNTFAQAGALAPIPRYDSRYAYCIGKWLLNLANAARLFFPSELPPENQSSYFWVKEQAGNVPIAYEALRQSWNGKNPYAMGDALKEGWAKTDLGLYGSGHIGLLSALVHRTNVKGIVMWDCLATDFYHSPAYPTYLIYNPYETKKEIEMDVGKEEKDIYEAVSHRFLKRNVKDKAKVSISPHSAILIVIAPAKGKLRKEGKKLLLNDIVLDYNFEN